MFSKDEKKRLKTEFWTAFGKSFPRKWLLYNTKIKDFSFKFFVDDRSAEVSLNLEMTDETLRHSYFEKIKSLEELWKTELPDLKFSENHTLANGKIISQISTDLSGVSLYNKNSWRSIFEFFVQNMEALERLYLEYEDYIKQV